jgi:transposase-like protein
MEEALKEEKKARRPRKYDEEFRRSVVEHWAESGKTAAAVSKDFGVNIWNLRDWKRRYEPAPKPPGGPQPDSVEGLRVENQALRQQLARVTSQREILKKSLAIISEA